MRHKNTIKIKNELPELLEAICNHKDCPEWLTDAIWEAFNNQNIAVNYSATFWRAQFEGIFERQPELETIDTTSDLLDAEVLR